MTPIVSVAGLSKQFRMGGNGRTASFASQIRGFLRGHASWTSDRFWALDDVTFEVAEGETFGIIGRNGSGKSTLLKILTGITRPTRGSALVRGRIGALLEVGTGFHPDLTGRENIYFNGMLLGMSRQEIEKKFDEIVAFAEVEKFIDMQIKHYSSGMQARLGFAVASHLRPDILIVDEVLSVGDLRFQEKCIDRMGEMRKAGITTLFVSHNLNSVAALCGRSLLLDRGKVKTVGESGAVIDLYLSKSEQGKSHTEFEDDPKLAACFNSVSLLREDGSRADQFDISEDIWIRLRYSVRRPCPGLQLALSLCCGREELMQTFDTDGQTFFGTHPAGTFERSLKVNKMFLKEGEYWVGITCGVPSELYAQHYHVLSFSIVARSTSTEHKGYRRDRAGKVILQGEWHERAEAMA